MTTRNRYMMLVFLAWWLLLFSPTGMKLNSFRVTSAQEVICKPGTDGEDDVDTALAAEDFEVNYSVEIFPNVGTRLKDRTLLVDFFPKPAVPVRDREVEPEDEPLDCTSRCGTCKPCVLARALDCTSLASALTWNVAWACACNHEIMYLWPH